MSSLAELKAEYIRLVELKLRRQSQRFIDTLYPDTGPLRRELYCKHMEFFEAGATYRERCACCANRIGKTLGMGGYETALHLTGQYPEWWPGRRFDKPIRAWAAGKTSETTRDIVQHELLGDVIGGAGSKGVSGTRLIPGATIGKVTWKSGVADLVDVVKVKHVSGGRSILGLKSYQQGRGSFEGTAQDLIWFDEEPPLDVYGEALIRTATTNGIIMVTFTPLLGLSEVVMQFMPQDMRPDE